MSRAKRFVVAMAVVVALGGTANAELVAYYPFDGSANEQTGNNIDLQLVGDATYGASMLPGFGQALSLDGDGDGAIGANFVKITGNDMTGMAWVYATDLSAEWNSIIKNWGQTTGGQFHFGLGSQAADTLQNFVGSGASVAAATPLVAGQWYHTTFVADSVALEQRLYLNGELVASAAYAGTLVPGAATGLGIGHKPDDTGAALATNGPGPWNGLIDDVALFDEALSQSDIQGVYRRGVAGIPIGTAIPEPSTAGLLILGMAGGLTLLRRRPLAFQTTGTPAAETA